MRGFLGRALAVLLAFTFPLATWCADMQGAVLSVSQSALVNSANVGRSTAIFAGDKVKLPADSHAFLNFAGTSVVIAPGSSFTYEGKALFLEQDSGVAVSTTTGALVKTGELTISPARNQGKFNIARSGGTILVAAKLGSVRVSDGSSVTTVAEGSTATLGDPSPQAPGATPGTTGVGVSKRTALIILGSLGAAAAAAIIAVETTGEPATPQSP